jgi:hypothetical protein
MICNVIGLGETAELWDGQGFSIGVNDCFKFRQTDCLVVVNSFRKLPEREKIITESRPVQGFYSNMSKWSHHPFYKTLNLQKFTKRAEPDKVYHSQTSPFIAISLAAYLGYTEIVLYGVDMVSHPAFKNHKLINEVRQYVLFVKELEKQGVKVYLYTNFGALAEHLPVWNG